MVCDVGSHSKKQRPVFRHLKLEVLRGGVLTKPLFSPKYKQNQASDRLPDSW